MSKYTGDILADVKVHAGAGDTGDTGLGCRTGLMSGWGVGQG